MAPLSDTLAQFGNDAVGYAVETAKKFNSGLTKISEPESKKQTDAQRKSQGAFDYKVLQYPSAELASQLRNPYWMTFFINRQELSHYTKGRNETATDSRKNPIRSTVQINADARRGLDKNLKHNNTVGFGRKTRRTQGAIRLFIPDTLSWSFGHGYRDVSLSGLPGIAAVSALASAPKLAESLTDGFLKGGVAGVLSELGKNRGAAAPALEVASDLVNIDKDLSLSAIGLAINPQIDVIYQSPKLREFTFDFLFAPKNGKEGKAVSDIIKEFKFHAAPEISGQGNALGRYFVPPSEFDIEFSVNTMGKISTCVLQDITVDYAPSGVAFYFPDDRPVNTRMTLRFMELEFITKELVEAGF